MSKSHKRQANSLWVVLIAFTIILFSVGTVRAQSPLIITNTANITEAGEPELDGARATTTAVIDGTTFLFTAAEHDDGIGVYAVGSDGSLSNVFNVTDDATLQLDGAAGITSTLIFGTTYLFVTGIDDDGVSVFSVNSAGVLSNQFNVTDDATLQLDGADGVTTAVVAGTTYLFVASFFDDGISVFSVSAGGELANVFNVTDNATLQLNGTRDLTAAVIDGTTYLFATGSLDDGVSVFSVSAAGALTNVANVTNNATLQLRGAIAADTAVIADTTYLFVVGFSDEGVSVFSVSDAGVLTNVDNVTDDAILELSDASSVTTAIIDGTTYLFGTGSFDDGVSVFSVNDVGLLTNVANVSDENVLQLDGTSSLATTVVGGTTFVVSTGFFDKGLSVFSVSSAGTLSNVFNVAGNVALPLNGVINASFASVGATTYLFVTSRDDDRVSVFSIAADGALTNVDNVVDNGSLELDGARAVTTAFIDGTTYLFVAGTFDDGVSVFSVSSDGTLINVDNVTDGGPLALSDARALTTAVVGGITYLFVARIDDDGVSVFSVNGAGILTNVDNITNNATLELDGALSLTTAVVGVTTYLFVAAINDDGVSVFSVSDSGLLTSVDNITDTGALRLNGARAVITSLIGGTTYLFVAGSFDDGVSVFSVNTAGILTHVNNISDAGVLELNSATAVSTIVSGGTTYLLVAGFSDDGFSVFSVEGGEEVGPATLVSAVLPSARSGFFPGGGAITIFATVINAGVNPAINCQVTVPAAAPVTVSYQETDAANAPIGVVNTPFGLTTGQARTFVLAFTPTATSIGTDVFPNFVCDNGNVAPITGVNTVFLSIGAAPVPDILSIGATITNDGIISLPTDGAGVMSVSTINIGVGDTGGSADAAITVSVDTGDAVLPLLLQVCEINAASICISALGPNVSTTIGDSARFFAVFVFDRDSGSIALNPANTRVFLRFTDSNGIVRSVTSAAVTVVAP